MMPLRKYLKKKRISQAAFARLMGVTESSVSYYLSGKRGMRLETARRASEITGIPILKLLFPGGLQ